jgi:hypothetical protein
MGIPRRLDGVANVPPQYVEGTGLGCSWSKELPNLVEFLSRSAWPDGKARETGTVLVCFGEGRWRLWLNDRDFDGLSAWVSAETLRGVLLAAEKGLAGNSLEWRAPRTRRGR